MKELYTLDEARTIIYKPEIMDTILIEFPEGSFSKAFNLSEVEDAFKNGHRVFHAEGNRDRIDPLLGRLNTTDAKVWVQEFLKVLFSRSKNKNVTSTITESGFLIGWFTHAIETGREAGHRDLKKKLNDFVNEI